MDAVLHVVLYGQHVADLTQTAGGGDRRLVYRDGALSTPVSVSMPVRGESYGRRRVDPFLLGLLPDSLTALDSLGRRFGVSARNPFALLEHVGLDCAGAIQLARPEQLASALAVEGEVQALSEVDIGERLRRLREHPAQWWADGEHWSLAGAQQKFALRAVAGGWARPTGAEPTTHIVKPGISALHAQALNEHLCLDGLRRAGVRATRSEYTEFDGEPAVVVERYDRRHVGEGTVLRVHQEDLCQALSVYPHRRYEADGGPTAPQVIDLLRRTHATGGSVERFVDALIVNYLLGAPDAHAKNYSILLVGDRVELAPLYDVASSLPYEAERGSALRRVAMKIAGKNAFGEVTPSHWRDFAGRSRIDADEPLERLVHLADVLPDAIRDAISAVGSAAGQIGPRLLDTVAEHCGHAIAARGARTPAMTHAAGTSPDPGSGRQRSRWVESHTRNGRHVKGYWRDLP